MRSLKSPTQRINLYREADRSAGSSPLGAMTLVWAFAVCMTLLVLGFVYFQVQISGLQAERDQVAAELDGYRQKLTQLKAQLPPDKADESLLARTSALRATASDLRNTLVLVSQAHASRGQGFGGLFRSLARHPVEGLWLSEIHASADGQDFVLRGETLEPVLVPRLLQALRGESAFRGRNFGEVLFEREGDDASALSFEMRTRREVASEG